MKIFSRNFGANNTLLTLHVFDKIKNMLSRIAPAMNNVVLGMSMGYKDMSAPVANAQQTGHLSGLSNVPAHQASRPNETSNYGNPTLGMQQSLDLRGNLGNLSHIVDRFPGDERMLPSAYYGDKVLSGPNMFSKPSATSASSMRR